MKGSLAMRKTLKRLLSAVLFVAMALSLVVGVSTAGQAATYIRSISAMRLLQAARATAGSIHWDTGII